MIDSRKLNGDELPTARGPLEESQASRWLRIRKEPNMYSEEDVEKGLERPAGKLELWNFESVFFAPVQTLLVGGDWIV